MSANKIKRSFQISTRKLKYKIICKNEKVQTLDKIQKATYAQAFYQMKFLTSCLSTIMQLRTEIFNVSSEPSKGLILQVKISVS